MHDYRFELQLKNGCVPCGERVALCNLREAHAYGMILIWRMLERVGQSSSGWVLRICDEADRPLLHVIVPATAAEGGAVGERTSGERLRGEEWSAAIGKLDALAQERSAQEGSAHDGSARNETVRDGLAGANGTG